MIKAYKTNITGRQQAYIVETALYMFLGYDHISFNLKDKDHTLIIMSKEIRNDKVIIRSKRWIMNVSCYDVEFASFKLRFKQDLWFRTMKNDIILSQAIDFTIFAFLNKWWSLVKEKISSKAKKPEWLMAS